MTNTTDNFNATAGQVIYLFNEDLKGTQTDSVYGHYMSKFTTYIIENVTHVGMIPVLALCGVTLNILSMVVFYRQGLSDRVNLCVFSLAVCDTGYMVFSMARRCYRILYLVHSDDGEYWKNRLISLVSVYVGFFNTSNCLTLLISMERCFCVVWPLKAKTILSLRTIKFLILLAFVTCFASSLLYHKYDVQSYEDITTNTTRYRLIMTTFYKRNRQIVDFVFENSNIFIPATSLAVVMVNTAIISVRLRTALAWRQGSSNFVPGQIGGVASSSKEIRETSVTRTLTVVCIIYTVCTLPYVVHAFVRLTVPEFGVLGKYRNTVAATLALLHAILCINSSSNFVVYYTMSSRFKETLYKLFKQRRTVVSGSKESSSKATVSEYVDKRTADALSRNNF